MWMGLVLNGTLYLEIGPSSERITVIAYNYSLKYIHRGAQIKRSMACHNTFCNLSLRATTPSVQHLVAVLIKTGLRCIWDLPEDLSNKGEKQTEGYEMQSAWHVRGRR